MNQERQVLEAVQSKYGSVAASGLSSEHAGVRAVAEAFGYSPEELASIPAEANMGLSCGNPTATAGLREGETVVDLGSGGGLDVLLAARKVGPTGRAIGIDMTPEMIDLARRNAEKAGLANVEFHPATIDVEGSVVNVDYRVWSLNRADCPSALYCGVDLKIGQGGDGGWVSDFDQRIVVGVAIADQPSFDVNLEIYSLEDDRPVSAAVLVRWGGTNN